MTYPILDENAARKLFESYKTNAFSSDDLVDVEGCRDGASFEKEAAKDLANILWEIAHDEKPGAKFERQVRSITHERLNLSSKTAGDPDFWRWLTFSSDGELAELVDWRYGEAEEAGSAKEKYFGFGKIKEGMYGYLWISADAVYDPTLEDQYELAKRGEDVDLWQSHIVRIDFGSVPQIARAFVKFVFPSEDEQQLSRDEYRRLAPELSRRNASMAYELMDEDACLAFIEEVWEERATWEN